MFSNLLKTWTAEFVISTAIEEKLKRLPIIAPTALVRQRDFRPSDQVYGSRIRFSLPFRAPQHFNTPDGRILKEISGHHIRTQQHSLRLFLLELL